MKLPLEIREPLLREPLPGTYGALTRSTEPWNWRASLERVGISPAKLSAHVKAMADEIDRIEFDKLMRDLR